MLPGLYYDDILMFSMIVVGQTVVVAGISFYFQEKRWTMEDGPDRLGKNS
jgi:hypothetical protein